MSRDGISVSLERSWASCCSFLILQQRRLWLFWCRAEGSGLKAAGAPKQAGLAGLFEPPHDIMFTGTFEEAKNAATEQSRWLVSPSSMTFGE